MSRELGFNGNLCEILDKYFEFTNKHRKIIENEFESQYKDYRDTDQKERRKHINNKLSKLPIQKKFSKQNLKDVMMNFDATSFYPSAMWHENSVYPKIESGFAFEPQMNDVYVEAFNNQFFNQDGNESAIFEINYYNTPDLIFQHLPVKENLKLLD